MDKPTAPAVRRRKRGKACPKFTSYYIILHIRENFKTIFKIFWQFLQILSKKGGSALSLRKNTEIYLIKISTAGKRYLTENVFYMEIICNVSYSS